MSNTSTHGSRFRAPPLAAAALILACSATMAAPATTTTVLTSAADNKNIAEWSMTSKEAHDPSPWSVRRAPSARSK